MGSVRPPRGVFLVMPYTLTLPDGHNVSSVFIVAADTRDAALLAANGVAEDGKEAEWGSVAEAADGAEKCGRHEWYMSVPCECGDKECQSEEDPHGSEDTTLELHPDESEVFSTLEEARAWAENGSRYPYQEDDPDFYDHRNDTAEDAPWCDHEGCGTVPTRTVGKFDACPEHETAVSAARYPESE